MKIFVPNTQDCSDSSYWTDVNREKAVKIGAEKLGATKIGRFFYYLAEETREVYRLTTGELASYGAGLLDNRGVDYSLWCTATGQLVKRLTARIRAAMQIGC